MSGSGIKVSLLATTMFCGVMFSAAASAQVATPPEEPSVEAPTPDAPGNVDESNGPEIVVTGSRIRQANLASVSPVTQVDAAQFEQRGAIRIEDVLNRLPQVIGAQGNNSSLRGITGTAQVDLRGLGATRTLVLVNGRRLPYGTPKSTPADLNLIPTQLIRNVEVLTGGASAVYGSDAIAGVVNITTIDNFEGLKLSANVGGYNHNNDDSLVRAALAPFEAANPGEYTAPDSNVWDGFAQEYSAVIGANINDNRGNVTAYATYRKTNEVKGFDRDFGMCKIGAAPGGEAYVCQPSPVGTPASFVTTGASGLPSQFRVDNGMFVPRNSLVDGWNSQPWGQIQRPEERYTFGALAHYEINSHLIPFLEINYARTHTASDYSPGAVQTGRVDATGTINCDNPFLSAQQQSYLCTNRGLSTGSVYDPATGAYIGPEASATGISLNRLTPETGNRHDDYRLSQFRAVLGARGELAGPFSYELSASYASSMLNRFQTGFPSQIRALTALNATIDRRAKADGTPLAPTFGQPVCVINADATSLNDDPNCSALDFYSAAGPSAAAIKYIGAQMIETGQSEQTDILATINGDLGKYGIKSPFAENGVGIAVGAEYRKNTAEINADAEFQAQQEDFPMKGSSAVSEIFGEINIPLIENVPGFHRLSFEGAYRYSSYKGSVSTDTYKLGLNWSPVKDLRLRGSYQRAVRAPNIIELYSAQLRQITLQLPINPNGNYDPCAGPTPAASFEKCANTGVTAAQYGNISDYNFFQQLIGGNPDLKPETAQTYSFGGVFTPSFIDRLVLSVDYYSIKVDGLISTINPTLSLSQCLNSGDPYFCSLIHRGVGGTLFATPDAYFSRINVNTGSLHTTGIDVSASYRLPLDTIFSGNAGDVDFAFTGGWVQKFYTKPLPTSSDAESYDCAGYYGYSCGGPRPKWRHNLQMTWNTPWDISVAATWRYMSAVKIARASDQPALAGSYAAIDKKLPAQSYFDLSGAWQARDNLVLRVGVTNLFDKSPPLSTIVDSISGGNLNTYPQFYDVLGRRLFATVSVEF